MWGRVSCGSREAREEGGARLMGFGVQVENPLGTRVEEEGALRVGAEGGRGGREFVVLDGATRALS